MGLFSRFTDIINANLNSMLDKAEQPEKMIRLIISEMEETLIEVRSSSATHIAEQKILTRKMASSQKNIAHWHNQAEVALAKDREDLAKLALTEKHKFQNDVAKLEEENIVVNELLEAIQTDAQRLREKLDEAKRRQEALVLRQQSAEVRLKIREKAVVHNIDAALTKFERYQQKIDHIEAQVDSYDLTEIQDLSMQISSLAQNDTIEAELATMKQKVVNN
jgi:phage shock protein A